MIFINLRLINNISYKNIVYIFCESYKKFYNHEIFSLFYINIKIILYIYSTIYSHNILLQYIYFYLINIYKYNPVKKTDYIFF